MFQIMVEYAGGCEQESYGPFVSWEEAHAAMPALMERHAPVEWIQISPCDSMEEFTG